MYSTFAQVSERLGGQISPAAQAFLESKIVSASDAIDRWCGQSFAAETVATARTFPVDAAMSVLVDPFHAVADLVIETDDNDDGVFETTWAAADYALARFGGRRANLLGSPFDCVIAVGSRVFPRLNLRPEPLRITAKWGWASTPTAVGEACEMLTAELWARRNAPFGITQSTSEFGGMRISRDLFAQVSSLLGDFRRFDRIAGIA
jgi:hypothetical protein